MNFTDTMAAATSAPLTRRPAAPDFTADKAVSTAERDLEKARRESLNVAQTAFLELAEIEALAKVAVTHLGTEQHKRFPEQLARVLLMIASRAQVASDAVHDHAHDLSVALGVDGFEIDEAEVIRVRAAALAGG